MLSRGFKPTPVIQSSRTRELGANVSTTFPGGLLDYDHGDLSNLLAATPCLWYGHILTQLTMLETYQQERHLC